MKYTFKKINTDFKEQGYSLVKHPDGTISIFDENMDYFGSASICDDGISFNNMIYDKANVVIDDIRAYNAAQYIKAKYLDPQMNPEMRDEQCISELLEDSGVKPYDNYRVARDLHHLNTIYGDMINITRNGIICINNLATIKVFDKDDSLEDKVIKTRSHLSAAMLSNISACAKVLESVGGVDKLDDVVMTVVGDDTSIAHVSAREELIKQFEQALRILKK